MRYAYVTFLMKNDSYLSGALTLAYSIRNNNKKHSLVCMITEEISLNAKVALHELFDEVIEIEQIKKSHPIKGGRQDRNLLLTRFSALLLEYDKIILLDADVLPLADINDLFMLPAPAGIINERKSHFISDNRSYDENDNWCWHNIYNPVCPHGTKIPKKITERVRYDNTNLGVNSALWRLDPNPDDYNQIINSLNNPEMETLFNNFPWPEMQLATLIWSDRWTNIDVRYCSISGFPNLSILKGCHFAGLKPWSIKNKSILRYATYDDFKEWYKYFLSMFYSFPKLQDISALKRIESFIVFNKLI